MATAPKQTDHATVHGLGDEFRGTVHGRLVLDHLDRGLATFRFWPDADTDSQRGERTTQKAVQQVQMLAKSDERTGIEEALEEVESREGKIRGSSCRGGQAKALG